MGLSRNKVAVSEGAAGSPPFYGECVKDSSETLAYHDFDGDLEDGKTSFETHIVQFPVNGKFTESQCYKRRGSTRSHSEHGS